MGKNEIIIIADYTEETFLSFAEVCELCNSSPEFIVNLVQYEIIQPHGESPEEWFFDMTHLLKVKAALRLQRDLEMNIPSIAVVLDLLEQVEMLQNRMAILERHILK